jgi:hypothetical protein
MSGKVFWGVLFLEFCSQGVSSWVVFVLFRLFDFALSCHYDISHFVSHYFLLYCVYLTLTEVWPSSYSLVLHFIVLWVFFRVFSLRVRVCVGFLFRGVMDFLCSRVGC